MGLLLQGLFSLLSKEFYRACRAHECEFESWGLGLVAGRAPKPLHGARGRSVVSLSFLVALAHPFRSEGGVCLPSPLECEPGSLGLGKAAGRAPEPLAQSERAIRSSLAFYATLAHPFRSEGGVEYARLPSMGASGDTSGELLSGKSEWRLVPHSVGVG